MFRGRRASGRILLAVELSRVDSLENDDCVDVTFLQVSGEPLLGTDGGLLAGQTLQRRTDTPVSTIEGAAIVDGRLVARPMEIELPLSMLDATFELSILGGGIQVDYEEDGLASGFFTGTVTREELLSLLESSPGIGNDVAELVSGLIDIALDVEDEDGECSMMSAGFVFDAARVYLVD